jgi:hypothetical protein
VALPVTPEGIKEDEVSGDGWVVHVATRSQGNLSTLGNDRAVLNV